MSIAYHADRLPGSEHRAKTPEGYLLAVGVPIARTGYQTYTARELQPSGIPEIDRLAPETSVPVYRDAKDVFDPSAMSTFEGKSITKTHPPDGFLTPDNDREFAKGHAQNIRGPVSLPDGTKALIADLVIKDAQLIQYIDDHVMEEISCGYRYKLEPLEDDYGYRMTNIVGNHVAIVPTGRAGNFVRVLDASPKGEVNQMEFKDFVESIKTLGLRIVGDGESETVATQRRKDEEALRLKNRVMDSEEEKKEKEAADKRMKDAEEKIEEVKKNQATLKEAVDSGFKKLMDAVEEMKKEKEAKDAECSCGQEGEKASERGSHHSEDCAMHDKAAKDADFIPSPTLHGTEVPQNPIPGADALQLVTTLRTLRPIIADSGDKEAIDAFNRAMASAKKRKPANDADYAKILAAAATIDPKAESGKHLSRATDGKAAPEAGSYQEMMKKFSRKNQSEWVMPSTQGKN